jgi:two-component system NtrC family sensor kinase
MSFTTVSPAADAFLKSRSPVALVDTAWGGSIRKGEIFTIADTESEQVMPRMREISRIRGWRSALFVPLLRDGLLIGAISVTRRQPGAFARHHVELLKTFADQAVIAIENVRLFDEVQGKTADLAESLQQQIATADVLKVISRSAFDLQKVLDTLADSAARLCDADIAVLHRSFGDEFTGVASVGLPEDERRTVLNIHHKPGRGSLGARVLQAKAAVVIDDTENDPEYTFRSFQRGAGIRSMLGVPLIREGAVRPTWFP